MVPDCFLGQPDINCEGATNLLIATLPMWGKLTITLNQVTTVVDLFGEIELTVTPTFKKGPAGTDTESSLMLDPVTTVINARRWTATVTSTSTPPNVAALATGDEFRSRFEAKFRQGFFFGQVTLPTIDASFLGPMTKKSTSVGARVRNGVLLIGLSYVDDTHSLAGNPEGLQDFASSNDVAGVVHPDAIDIMLDDVHSQLLAGVQDAGASLDSFHVRARNGHFDVTGTVSSTGGSVNFSFQVVPSMFHTRPGAYFGYMKKPVRVRSQTWAALEFRIEDVQTDVDRSWWVILFGEVIGGIVTAGLSVLYIEGLISAAASEFGGRISSAKPGAPTARIRTTIPPPGGVSVRIALDQFEVTESGVYVGISVTSKPSPTVMFGPATVPETYRGDELRYILRPPSGVADNDPALRIHWTLEDRTNDVVLQDADGPAAGRLRFEFSPASASANDFTVVARLYRRLGVMETELGTQSVSLHMRGTLSPQTYVRWRWQGTNPQLRVEPAQPPHALDDGGKVPLAGNRAASAGMPGTVSSQGTMTSSSGGRRSRRSRPCCPARPSSPKRRTPVRPSSARIRARSCRACSRRPSCTVGSAAAAERRDARRSDLPVVRVPVISEVRGFMLA